ncbi:MAG: ankyrin repeat domain-containing protein [Myxococcota bacterium]
MANKEAQLRLLAAIRGGDALRIQDVAKNSPSALQQMLVGRTPLYYAAAFAPEPHRAAIVEQLLRLGLRPNETDDDGDVPLSGAAMGGDERSIGIMIEYGATVDGTITSSATPLMTAATEGQNVAARALMRSGADTNRESLRTPLTPLGFANYYRAAGTGQDKVAEYLISQGGIDPFNGPERDWAGVRGQAQVEAVEATLGRVHPVPYVRSVTGVDQVTVYRTRFLAQKYLFQLLFTADLALVTGYELALCLRSTWPMHKAALAQATFRWPLDLLFHWAEEAVAGRAFAHGDATTAREAGAAVPPKLEQWLVCNHASFELARERRLGAAPMLLVVPHLLKTPLKPGRQSRQRADKKYEVLWTPPASRTGRNSLVVPQCFDAPWLGENFLRG